MASRLLVVGGSGYIGSAVVRRAVQSGRFASVLRYVGPLPC